MCVASAWTRFHLRLPTCVAFASVVILGFPPLDWPQQRRQQQLQQRLVLSKAEIPTQRQHPFQASVVQRANLPIFPGADHSSVGCRRRRRGAAAGAAAAAQSGGGSWERRRLRWPFFERDWKGTGWRWMKRLEETNKNLIIAVFSRLTLAS